MADTTPDLPDPDLPDPDAEFSLGDPEEGLMEFDKALLDELRERYDGVLEPLPEATATDAIPHDMWDERTWRAIREKSTDLDWAIKNKAENEDYVEDLYLDMFNAGIKADPQVRDYAEMDPRYIPNREIVDMVSHSQEFQALRDFTVNDEFATAMAVMSMDSALDNAYALMRVARERAEELAKMLEELAEQQEKANTELEAGDGIAAGSTLQEVEKLTQSVQQARDSLAAAAANGASSGMNKLRKAAQEAAQQAEDDAAAAAAFGCEPGELQKMDFKERAVLAKRLQNSRVYSFAKLIGAFRALALAESTRRVNTTPSEISGVTFGDDLTRMLPQEMINLAEKETEDEFWLRYAEGRLLTWELSGKEKQGRGPIIVICDESGSMGAADLGGNTREAWSKALIMALADQAKRDKRDFHYIGFSSAGQLWHADLSGKKFTMANVMPMVEHFFGGGTSYLPGLTLGLDVAKGYFDDQEKGRPDIVFISDDEFGFSENEMHIVKAYQAEKTRMMLRTWGILIGPQAVRPGSAVFEVSDNVRTIHRLVNDFEAIADIFRTM